MSRLKIVASSSPSSSLVDRLALHLFQSFDPTRPSARRWRELHGWQREHWRERARAMLATIEAAASSDERVIDAGVNALAPCGAIDTRSTKTKAGDVFAAMLFEAMEG